MASTRSYAAVALTHISQYPESTVRNDCFSCWKVCDILFILAELKEAGTRSPDKVLDCHNNDFVERIGTNCEKENVVDPLVLRSP